MDKPILIENQETPAQNTVNLKKLQEIIQQEANGQTEEEEELKGETEGSLDGDEQQNPKALPNTKRKRNENPRLSSKEAEYIDEMKPDLEEDLEAFVSKMKEEKRRRQLKIMKKRVKREESLQKRIEGLRNSFEQIIDSSIQKKLKSKSASSQISLLEFKKAEELGQGHFPSSLASKMKSTEVSLIKRKTPQNIRGPLVITPFKGHQFLDSCLDNMKKPKATKNGERTQFNWSTSRKDSHFTLSSSSHFKSKIEGNVMLSSREPLSEGMSSCQSLLPRRKPVQCAQKGQLKRLFGNQKDFQALMDQNKFFARRKEELALRKVVESEAKPETIRSWARPIEQSRPDFARTANLPLLMKKFRSINRSNKEF